MLSTNQKSPKKDFSNLRGRIHTVGAGILVAFAILGIRLWDLQIVRWHDYLEMAECNRLHPERLVAPRGMICGPDHLLNHICYEIGVRELILRGYLCPLKTKAGRRKVDTSALHIRGGEFIAGEVEARMAGFRDRLMQKMKYRTDFDLSDVPLMEGFQDYPKERWIIRPPEPKPPGYE